MTLFYTQALGYRTLKATHPAGLIFIGSNEEGKPWRSIYSHLYTSSYVIQLTMHRMHTMGRSWKSIVCILIHRYYVYSTQDVRRRINHRLTIFTWNSILLAKLYQFLSKKQFLKVNLANISVSCALLTALFIFRITYRIFVRARGRSYWLLLWYRRM